MIRTSCPSRSRGPRADQKRPRAASSQFNWRIRGEWKPEAWHLGLVTVVDGEVVGSQGIRATTSPSRRASRPAPGSASATREGDRKGDARRGAALRVRRPRRRGRVERRVGDNATFARCQRGARLRAERRAHRRSARSGRPSHRAAPPPLGPGRRGRRDDICIEGLDECRTEFGLDRSPFAHRAAHAPPTRRQPSAARLAATSSASPG